MSQYLLLRDNKQSGPYTFEELTAKGLKGYDLIWIEGKSAAWRYPSEIQELKPFAPVIEEQPYDRFYKRQDSTVKRQTSTINDNSAAIASRSNATLSTFQAGNVVNSTSSTDTTQQLKKTTTSPSTNRRVVVILPGGMYSTEKPAEKVVFQEPLENKIVQPEKKPGNSKEPVYRQTVASALETDPLLVTFTKQSQYGRDVRDTSKNSLSANAPKLFAGTLVVLTIGVLIGWGVSRSITEKNSTPVSTPTEVVNIPEPQSVYNNESVQTVSNDDSEAGNELTDENLIPEIYQQPADSAMSKINAMHAVQKKPAVQRKKHPATDIQAQLSEPDSQHAEHTRNDVPPIDTDKEEVEMKMVKKNLHELIKVSESEFKIGAFGGISNLKLKVTNSSPYPLDLVVVEVKYLLANKKEFKSEKLYFKNLAVGESVVQEAPKSSRGIEVISKLSLISSKALGIHQASL